MDYRIFKIYHGNKLHGMSEQEKKYLYEKHIEGISIEEAIEDLKNEKDTEII